MYTCIILVCFFYGGRIVRFMRKSWGNFETQLNAMSTLS